jgi:drug/metabolite transporter (DMT)-like permease
VSTAALAFVLVSAALHAAWNALVADARDTYATTAVALVAGVVVLTPFAVARWDLDAAALPWAAASAALELAYFAALARAYAGAELTTVYPVARGAAPVIALIVSVAFLSAPVGALQAVGVVGVGVGVLLVRGWGAGRRDAAGRDAGSAVPLALGIAACIAGYTLVDDRGVRHASPVPYFALVLAATAAVYVAALAWRRRGPRLRAALGWRSVAAGVGMVVAYVLVLLALERAEAAPVAALRETGVVMATAAAAIAGRRRVPLSRVVGAGVVVAGVAAIALG